MNTEISCSSINGCLEKDWLWGVCLVSFGGNIGGIVDL